jgi:hypothetical protein
MSMLRNLEAKLGGIVEGAFGRAFKSNVQPVELARKLAKEMEENQTVSISRVYVPNHYRVFLSPADREQFHSYEPALRKELSDYLLEHGRQEGLALTRRPAVELMTDERLNVGEFGIQAQLLVEEDDAPSEEAPAAADFGHTMVYTPTGDARRPPVTLSLGGDRLTTTSNVTGAAVFRAPSAAWTLIVWRPSAYAEESNRNVPDIDPSALLTPMTGLLAPSTSTAIEFMPATSATVLPFASLGCGSCAVMSRVYVPSPTCDWRSEPSACVICGCVRSTITSNAEVGEPLLAPSVVMAATWWVPSA